MNSSKALLAALMLFSSSTAFASSTFTLSNGDKITGEIVEKNNNEITVKTVYGVLSIPVSMLKVDVDAAAVEVAQPQPAKEVILPVEEEEKLFLGASWSGNVNAGGKLRQGNKETEAIYVDVAVKADFGVHQTMAVVDYNYETERNKVTTDDRTLTLSHKYNFSDRWFWHNEAQFEQDDMENLDLRTRLSSGLGYHIFKRDDLVMNAIVAPGFQRESYDDATHNDMTMKWAFNYEQRFREDSFRLYHNHDVTSPVNNNFEAFLFQSKTGVRVPLMQGIIASGEVSYEWNNGAPKGTDEEDIIYTMKLGYEW